MHEQGGKVMRLDLTTLALKLMKWSDVGAEGRDGMLVHKDEKEEDKSNLL